MHLPVLINIDDSVMFIFYLVFEEVILRAEHPNVSRQSSDELNHETNMAIIKNLKLCILVFTPNMLLPFTLKTFINIANYAEKYEFIYTHSGILIIYHNITNYNINIKNDWKQI